MSETSDTKPPEPAPPSADIQDKEIVPPRPAGVRWAFVRRILAGLRKFVITHRTAILGAIGAVLLVVLQKSMDQNWGRPESTKSILELIKSEANLVLQQRHDAQRYGELFTGDAMIVDAANPSSASRGRHQIVDRYRHLPKFTVLIHTVIEAPVIYDDETASAVTRGTLVFADASLQAQNSAGALECWTFKKTDGAWKISVLKFNTPACR